MKNTDLNKFQKVYKLWNESLMGDNLHYCPESNEWICEMSFICRRKVAIIEQICEILNCDWFHSSSGRLVVYWRY
jgi:hypothetical protein